MISATSPNQEGVEGTDSRSGLDTHRDIGDTRHVYLLVENRFVLSLQGGTFLGWFATAYISLRNSWAMQALARVLPNAQHYTLEGQTHMVKAPALAPALTEFFESRAS